MAIIRPFNALRPAAEHAAEVAAVPYDVVNTEEARALASGNPFSFLHVSRAEIDLPDGTPIYSDEVYGKAADNFAKLRRECPLQSEETPSLYLYRLNMGEHEQIGVVACCSVEEYDASIIRKHERTRRDKEDDRTRHILILRAQTGPVFLTYRAHEKIDALVGEALTGNPPLYDFVANDDIRHTIWRVPTYDPLVGAFKEVPFLYIADGHHRAASAARARAELNEQSFARVGNEEYNFFQCVLFPDDQLQILPYNRIVHDLNGLSSQDVLAKVREQFEITENGSPSPRRRRTVFSYFELFANFCQNILRRQTIQIVHDAVIRKNLQLVIGKQNALKEVVLLVSDTREALLVQFCARARGAGCAMMAISDVEERNFFESSHQRIVSRYAPDRVTNVVVGDEVIQ